MVLGQRCCFSPVMAEDGSHSPGTSHALIFRGDGLDWAIAARAAGQEAVDGERPVPFDRPNGHQNAPLEQLRRAPLPGGVILAGGPEKPGAYRCCDERCAISLTADPSGG